MLEEDAFEWSAQYNDYLVHYYDSAEEDPETHTDVCVAVAEERYGSRCRGFERAAASSTGPGARQGKRRRR